MSTAIDRDQAPGDSVGPDENGLDTWREAERIITEMLRVATLRLPLYETLDQCLSVLLRTSWLRVQDKGGVFLVGDDKRSLDLVVDHNLGDRVSSMCAKVAFGQCLCGRAAATKTIQHAHCVDDRHENMFEGMKPHGHYNVPILKQDELLGVVVMYLPDGSKQDPAEITFLRSAADIFSLIIQIKNHEVDLEETVALRTRALEAEIVSGKRKEAALSRSERRLAELLELAPEAIISVDDNGKIVLFNRSAEDLFGFTKSELIGQPLESLLPVRFRENHLGHVHAFRDGGDTIRLMGGRGEIAGLRKDGTEFPARGAISKMGADDDRMFTILLQDVTDMKRAETALLAAKLAAEGANRAKTEFLANTSHEFKTPLNAIIGFAEIIARGDDKYGEYGRTIKESGEDLLGLIEDVLDISRMETGETTLREEELVISDLLADAIERTRRRFGGTAVDLVLETDDDRAVLFADKRMAKQIISNLLSNAVKFSPDGGIVRVRTRLDKNQHVIEVSDSGIGMDPEDLERALTPFWQLDSSLSRKYEGVGLGLSLVKLYADVHGASLNIESKKDEGTTVTIRFPPERTV